MGTKKLLIIAAVIVVGVIYYYLYKDRFTATPLQVQVMVRPMTGKRRPPANAQQDPELVIFSLNGNYKLTSIKVTPASALETNQYALPIWHLVTESNSAPTDTFTYGARLRGMHPEVKGSTPDPLMQGSEYVVVVEAGSKKVTHRFKIPGEPPPAQ